MIKLGSKWVTKEFTDVYSKQETGTLHAYDYFENEDGTWTYNIKYHSDYGFSPVQITLKKKSPIQEVLILAHEKYLTTHYIEQPYSRD